MSNALEQSNAAEKALLKRIRTLYGKALKTAISNQKRFFRLIEEVESGRKKPPAFYDAAEKVQRWRNGFVREALRQQQVIDGIMTVINRAGRQIVPSIQSGMADVYRYNRDETVELLTEGAGRAGMTPTFAQYDKRQIRALLYDGPGAAFSKIAYRNLGQNTAVRRRLQNELTQATVLGEGQRKIIERIRAVVGDAAYNARRTVQTERTRVQSGAREMAIEEAAAQGVNVAREWSCQFLPAYHTKSGHSSGSRESHKALDGVVMPAGQPFHTIWGNDLMYPGDPSAPAREVINCHCVIVPVVVETNVTVEGPQNTVGMYRKYSNDGVFSSLPERMSKKHIRSIAKEYDIDLSGISLVIDTDPEKMKDSFFFTGRADTETMGRIDFFPKAFWDKEMLTRTLYHEKIHVNQFREFGADYVQNNRRHFEDLAEEAENIFIENLKREGRL